MYEKPFNLKRDGKRKIGSLDKVTEKKTSQPKKNQEKKIGKKNKYQIPARRNDQKSIR